MAQRVLITAGASGIGKEIARAFADLSTATPIISAHRPIFPLGKCVATTRPSSVRVRGRRI